MDSPNNSAESRLRANAGDVLDVKRAKRTRRIGWLFFLGGFAVIAIGGGVAGLSPYRMGQVLGDALVAVLIVAFVGHLVRPKNGDPASLARSTVIAGAVFAGICVLILISGISGNSQERADAAALVARMDKLAEIQKTLNDGSVPAAPTQAPLPDVPVGGSDGSKLGAWMDRATQKLLAARGTYQRAVQAAQLNQIWSPATLTSKSSRHAARERIASISSAIDQHERDLLANRKFIEEDLGNLHLSEGTYRQILDGYKQGVARNNELTDEWLVNERAIVALAQELLDFMDKMNPPAYVENNTLVFPTQSAADRYNHLVQEIQRLSMQEAEIVEEQTRRMENARDTMRRDLIN